MTEATEDYMGRWGDVQEHRPIYIDGRELELRNNVLPDGRALTIRLLNIVKSLGNDPLVGYTYWDQHGSLEPDTNLLRSFLEMLKLGEEPGGKIVAIQTTPRSLPPQRSRLLLEMNTDAVRRAMNVPKHRLRFETVEMNIVSGLGEIALCHDNVSSISTAISIDSSCRRRDTTLADNPTRLLLKIWICFPHSQIDKLAARYDDPLDTFGSMEHGILILQYDGDTVIMPPYTPHYVFTVNTCYLAGQAFQLRDCPFFPWALSGGINASVAAENAEGPILRILEGFGEEMRGHLRKIRKNKRGELVPLARTWMARRESLRGLFGADPRSLWRRITQIWEDHMTRLDFCPFCSEMLHKYRGHLQQCTAKAVPCDSAAAVHNSGLYTSVDASDRTPSFEIDTLRSSSQVSGRRGLRHAIATVLMEYPDGLTRSEIAEILETNREKYHISRLAESLKGTISTIFSRELAVAQPLFVHSGLSRSPRGTGDSGGGRKGRKTWKDLNIWILRSNKQRQEGGSEQRESEEFSYDASFWESFRDREAEGTESVLQDCENAKAKDGDFEDDNDDADADADDGEPSNGIDKDVRREEGCEKGGARANEQRNCEDPSNADDQQSVHPVTGKTQKNRQYQSEHSDDHHKRGTKRTIDQISIDEGNPDSVATSLFTLVNHVRPTRYEDILKRFDDALQELRSTLAEQKRSNAQSAKARSLRVAADKKAIKARKAKEVADEAVRIAEIAVAEDAKRSEIIRFAQVDAERRAEEALISLKEVIIRRGGAKIAAFYEEFGDYGKE
ncbi:hypothetical protein LTR17_006110 [Elasticomyces elasticus]|nr:hypothetical protein LTR17_006110 [Elasticomyces elasticus]